MSPPGTGSRARLIDFSAIYQTHAAHVHRFALFLSGDPTLAEDLTAESFVRLWLARERLELATVRAYLFAIARNLYLQQRRGRRPQEPFDEATADPRPGPAERAMARDELASTLAALQALPELDRAALLMRADEELAYEEIAAALGLTLAAVRVRVHRARLKLVEAREIAAAPRSIPEDPR